MAKTHSVARVAMLARLAHLLHPQLAPSVMVYLGRHLHDCWDLRVHAQQSATTIHTLLYKIARLVPMSVAWPVAMPQVIVVAALVAYNYPQQVHVYFRLARVPRGTTMIPLKAIVRCVQSPAYPAKQWPQIVLWPALTSA
jgi:hypothetical protein